MTTTRDTKTLARCIAKCAASSDGRAHAGAMREARNALSGDPSIRAHAATAAALVGMSIARIAAQWRTA